MRPEFVVCVMRTHKEHQHKTWCDKIPNTFCFTGLEHAAENGKQNGRLVACPECVTEATKALCNGHEDL